MPLNNFPLQQAVLTGATVTSGWSLGGASSIKRLNGINDYFPLPLGITYLGVWRLSANVTITITYSL
jgi:hypothetical protein